LAIGLNHFLILAALLFVIGLLGALTKKNAIVVLISIELMLNAVNIAFAAFSRFVTPADLTGQVFSIFIIVVAAAEVAVGLAFIIAVYRHKDTIDINKINLLKW
jgi:NAD(P)H-quinone oxidoreductase subunit 4L